MQSCQGTILTLPYTPEQVLGQLRFPALRRRLHRVLVQLIGLGQLNGLAPPGGGVRRTVSGMSECVTNTGDIPRHP